MPRQRQHLTLALLACALFLRAMVPSGWMPAAHAGLFAVEPCPSADPVSMHMTGPAGHHHEQGKAGIDCFASMLAGAGLPNAAIIVDAPAAASPELPAIIKPSPLGRASPALPPPSTGPPTLA